MAKEAKHAERMSAVRRKVKPGMPKNLRAAPAVSAGGTFNVQTPAAASPARPRPMTATTLSAGGTGGLFLGEPAVARGPRPGAFGDRSGR